MGLTTMNNDRPTLIVGKTGTGKTTMAMAMFSEPMVFYGNEIEVFDIGALPRDRGILVEDIHYKPKKDVILSLIRNYRGKLVLTSINKKSVPKEILNACKVKLAGSKNYLRESIQEIAPRTEEPLSYERDTFSLVNDYLKNTDRELVREALLYNKPSDTQILNWVLENVHPNKLLFVDGRVKRRWSQRYFYEMLAYVHNGRFVGRLSFPQRKAYSKIPFLCKRLGVRNERQLKQLLQDEDYKKYVMTKLNNSDCRLIGLEKKKRKDPVIRTVKQASLGEF